MADQPTIDELRNSLSALRQRVAELEMQINLEEQPREWRPAGFYSAYYATVGFFLGGVAAIVSLMLNVVGSKLAGLHPLQIIRVYLTFPLGERALELTASKDPEHVVSNGMILALGCCLYLATGMALGILFHLVICRVAEHKSLVTRLIIGTILGIAVWLINFYFILSWLQPALFGGSWITDNSILPWWVALATHVVFGWTMAVLAPLGVYVPYRRPTEIA